MFKVLPGVEALSAKAKEDFTAEDVRIKRKRERHVSPCNYPPPTQALPSSLLQKEGM